MSKPIVQTRGSLRTIPATGAQLALNRFFKGDWGDVSPEDAAKNDEDRRTDRCFSLGSYTYAGVKFWIIESGEGITVLLPEEY